MTNPNPQQTPPSPPTPATVHSGITIVQWLSGLAAAFGAVASYVPAIEPQGAPWLGTVVLTLGALGLFCGALAKGLNSKGMSPLILIGLALIMGGCSNLTANQRYKLDATAYDVSVVAYTAANAAGKVPAQAQAPAQAAFTDAGQRLTQASAWIAANPTLANTPGVSPPSLDALDIAIDVVRTYARKYLFVAPLVPLDPPATQPATTQPVLIPIPG